MRKTFMQVRWVVLFAIMFSAAVSAQSNPANAQFRRLIPSIPLIETLDGHVAGVVLTGDGLILTSYRAVAAQPELKVRVKQTLGTRTALAELEDVKVLKVHPKYDLALIKGTVRNGVTLSPVTMLPKTIPLRTGMRCYVLGNPSAAASLAMEPSVIEGELGSASTMVDGLAYIEVSNVWASGILGAPVCDESGRVFGIVAMNEVDSLQYSVPTQNVALSEFVEVRNRPAAEKEGRQHLDMYASFADLAGRLSSGQQQPELLMQNLRLLRKASAALPNDPDPLLKLADASIAVGNLKHAKGYVEAALERSPENSQALLLLGNVLAHQQDGEAVSLQAWLRGAGGNSDPASASLCAEKVALKAIGAKAAKAAGYMLRWATDLHVDPSPDSKRWRETMWRTLEQEMPAPDLALLKGFAGPFDAETYGKLAKGESLAILKSTAPAVAVAMADKPAAGKDAGSGGTSSGIHFPTPEQMDQVIKSAGERFKPLQQQLPAEGAEVPLPDETDHPILGNAGWQLIMPFRSLSKIGIFNLATLKFDGYIDVPEPGVMQACGGNVLGLYIPSTRRFELYDLNTLQKIGSQVVELNGKVSSLAMALLNPAQILVHREVPLSPSSMQWQPAFVRIPDFKMSYPATASRSGSPYWTATAHGISDDFQSRLDERGMVCASWPPKLYPGGCYVSTITPDGRIFHDHKHTYGDDAQPSFPGEAIVARAQVFLSGKLENAFGERDPKPRGSLLGAIAGYPGFVGRITERYGSLKVENFGVYHLPGMELMYEMPTGEREPIWYDQVEGSPRNPQLLASAYSDRLVLIQKVEKRMRVYPLGLAARGFTWESAPVGKLFQRLLHLPAGAEASLQDAPQGMIFDNKSRVLSWNVPADATRGKTWKVLLMVQTPDGKQEYRTEQVTVP